MFLKATVDNQRFQQPENLGQLEKINRAVRFSKHYTGSDKFMCLETNFNIKLYGKSEEVFKQVPLRPYSQLLQKRSGQFSSIRCPATPAGNSLPSHFCVFLAPLCN